MSPLISWSVKKVIVEQPGLYKVRELALIDNIKIRLPRIEQFSLQIFIKPFILLDKEVPSNKALLF